MKRFLVLLAALFITSVCYSQLPISELSAQDKARLKVAEFKKRVEIEAKRRQDFQTNIFEFVWDDKEVPMQDFFDIYGTSATAVFMASRANEEDIKARINVNWEYQIPPYAVTFNEDGSVTIGECLECSE